jgi:hypothetical protein
MRYRRIAASINEVGVIEPLVVGPRARDSDCHRLLDGNICYDVLCRLAEQQALCLIARDDEAFTYNKRLNPLSTIQEHLMIARALDRGVSEERLARALDLDLQVIKRRRFLLNGICSEVAEMLRDRSVNPMIFEILRKMSPGRQIDSTQCMLTVGKLTSAYARALLAGTKQGDLAEPNQPKKVAGLTAEQMTRMEQEMDSLHRDLEAIAKSCHGDVLTLTIARGYLSTLLGNVAIRKFLGQRYPEVLEQFEAIIDAISRDQSRH